MARGRDESAWLRTQVVIQRLSACWLKGGFKPEECNPYHQGNRWRRDKPDSPENKRRMQEFLSMMHAQYGGKR